MTGFCQRQPAPGDYLGDACGDCGHSAAMHIGVDHCPVCELVDLAKQYRESEPTPVTVTVAVDAHTLTDADWTRLIARLQLRNRTSLSQTSH